MNEQMERLYEAAKKLTKTEGKSAVARLLNVSPQNIGVWEDRGVSFEGMVAAQELIGCDAVWIKNGSGNMMRGVPAVDDLGRAARLISLYAQSTSNGRQSIIDSAEAAEKISASISQASSGN
jgi:hypothetical protein